MKIKLQVASCRLQVPRRNRATPGVFSLQPSAFNLQPSRRRRAGVALIITLILLAVTLVMAVAFLAVSRRERASVNTSTDIATARLAADSALAAAQAQIAAGVLASAQDAYDAGLLVSTNYVNTNSADPLFNTYFYNNGSVKSGTDLETAVTNQWILPRAPVFVVTNQQTGSNDFRFYLDLNRNGAFEDSGDVPNVDYTGATNGTIAETGDPQWIGVLAHPDKVAGPDNPFVSRYAFFAQPIGNSLDLNSIHNQTLNPGLNPAQDGYFRNEGVGSWELNLAAFLTDLNTNLWDPVTAPYIYGEASGNINSGVAFSDAFALLDWRYANNYNSLTPIGGYFPNSARLQNLPVDVSTLGPLLNGLNVPLYPNNPGVNWAGADNTNQFFALTSDLFDPAKSSPQFVGRLMSAGSPAFSRATYDRYTFYRMLDQLGAGAAAPADQMNLNYDNLGTNGVALPGAETNLVAWTPLRFFTNAADRMLRDYTANWRAENYGYFTNTFGGTVTNAFGVGHVPVYVDGRFVYSPAVNRLLQLAANMYDATTNAAGFNLNGRGYPSVFRPTFTVTNENGFKNVYIDGYEYVPTVSGINDPVLNNVIDAQDLVLGHVTRNVYGVPWILGAKKGFPAFNQFYMLNAVEVTRKLMVSKLRLDSPLSEFVTNQMYNFSISNSLGCSFWNSYTNDYRGNLTIQVNGLLSMALTNNTSVTPLVSFYNVSYGNTYTTNDWPGTAWGNVPPYTSLKRGDCFITPVKLTAVLLTNSIYRYGAPGYFDPFNPNYQTTVETPALPQFGLNTTNRLQAFILDGNHVIDYVQFAGPQNNRDLSAELADPGISTGNNVYLWSTNPFTADPAGTPWGVVNQIYVSKGDANPAPSVPQFWKAPPNMPGNLPKTPLAEQAFVQGFFNVNPAQYGVYFFNGKRRTNSATLLQMPYTPTRALTDYTSWQVNDPLVHQLASELNYVKPDQTGLQRSDDPNNFLPDVKFGSLSQNYAPWGVNYPALASGSGTVDGTFQTALKDPLIWRPDDWNFPAYKLPTSGWLGRVHRGTPWQTVYLKATNIVSDFGGAGLKSWAAWSGDQQTVTNGYHFDALNSGPAQDAWLFDLFTARPNENAAKGALSVNQSHLAAWSAVLSGVLALTNSGPDHAGYMQTPLVGSTIAQPAGVAGYSSPLGQIVASIYNTRTNFVNPDGVKGVFESAGDVLRAPALSDQSPFLNWNDVNQHNYAISDALYEWLPQQIMGLLRVSSAPRYVVYCYGQTLRPAPGGVVLSGPNFNLVTNYQVTAESAARAVVQVNRNLVRDAAGNVTGTNYTTTVESYNVLPPD